MSVVVPVFRPDRSFDDLITSLDRQTLSRSDFEVLLCDDGSGEETEARLAEVARTRPYVRVLNLPHSGWPGTPRNRGVESARGTYVQFVDQDDWLFEEALEKLCDYADRNESDVVVGKEVGIGRELPSRIFRRDIPRATLGTDPLLEMLTPHKMFRTAFLRENGIRFPDGKVRLEDHLFVMQAYFAARTISILASTPCYAWVKHPGSASSSRIDPESYFPHLEAVLDIVEAHTEPGRLRDRLLRHWFRGKILNRLAGRKMLKYPAAYRNRLLDVVGPLARERFGPGVDGGLAFPHRIRAALLRADRRDDLVRFAQFETELECRADVTSARWSRGGGLYLTVDVRVTRDGADALTFAPGSGALTSLPLSDAALSDAALSDAALSDLPPGVLVAGRELQNDRVEVLLDGPRSGDGRVLATGGSSDLRTVTLAIDPLKVFGAADESRGGRIVAKVRRAGWTFDVPLQADAAVLARAGRSPLLAGRPCVLVAGPDGAVELRREWPGGRVKDTVGRAVRRARRAGVRLGAVSGSRRRSR
ncbi:MAG: glycosyltransferase family A protein [Candidatus Microbacterium colombiense]|nr:MAG: glycosyltransferase family A protein [Microbacterium sp.]